MSAGFESVEMDPEEEELAIAFEVLEELGQGVSLPWGLAGFPPEPEEAPQPTRELYLSPDGTPMIWDANTALLMRSTYRMLPRPVGMASVRIGTGIKCLPVTLMLTEAAFAVEKGWLKLTAGPSPDDPLIKGGEVSANPTWIGAIRRPPKSGAPTIEMIRDYSDPREEALRAVYKDLWSRGLTIGTGNPYGVDFTIYEGDPMAFHSFAAVYIVDGDFNVSSDKVASIVRLQQSVLKLLILAIVTDAKDNDREAASSSSSKAVPMDDDGHHQQQQPAEDRVLVPPIATERRRYSSMGPPAVPPESPWSKFGPPRSYVENKVIEYVTFRFVSVSRRMD